MTRMLPASIAAGPVLLELLDPERGGDVADVVNADLDHLRPWMPWAHRPTNAQEQAMRLATSAATAADGDDASYTITVDGRIVGGCGLHARSEPGERDIGYWIAASDESKGYVTAAAAGLARVAFEVVGSPKVRITCDEANVRSAAVPARLGFTHEVTLEREASAPAETGRFMVWVLTADEWPESPGYDVPVSYA